MNDDRNVERFGWSAVKVLFAIVVVTLAINPASKGRTDGQRRGLETVLPAQIRAAGFLDAVAPETGRVSELRAVAGRRVEAGDVLAVIESAELNAALERARTRAQLAKLRTEGKAATTSDAQAQWLAEQQKAAERGAQAAAERVRNFSLADAEQAFETARKRAAQVRELAAKQLATAQELENAEASEKNELRNLAARKEQRDRLAQELSAAESQLKMARLQTQSQTAPAGSEAAQLDLEDALGAAKSLEARQAALRMVAPWAGTVLRVNAVAGAIVGGGSALIQIADTAKLDFDAYVPASVARSVHAGDAVKVRVPLDPPREIAARIASVLLQPEAGQPSYVIRVRIPNPAPDTVLIGLEGSIILEH